MIQFFTYKRDGVITNRQVIDKYLTGLPDGNFLVKIEQKKKRSLPQNAFYWGVVCDMVKDGLRDAGYSEVKTIEDAHEILKALFLKRKIVNQQTDEVIEIPGSTAKLTTVQFNEYIEEIQRWASEYLSITIPSPNEQASIF